MLGDAEIRYAPHDGAHLAYRVFGDGPPLLWVPSQFIPISAMDEEPAYERFLDGLARYATVIVFDRRGIGSSDPLLAEPTVEDWATQVGAVMTAAGYESAFIVAHAWGGLAGVTLAATQPDRVRGLVLAVAAVSPGSPALTLEEVVGSVRPAEPARGVDFVAMLAPSRAGDIAFRRWWDSAGPRGASPSVAQRLLALQMTADATDLLGRLQVPTLVINRPNIQSSLEVQNPFVVHLDEAQVADVNGVDTLLWLPDSDAVVAEIEDFVTGARSPGHGRRRLLAAMFTDVVGSTAAAAELGDQRWREILETHDRSLRAELLRHHGTEIDTAGDGFLATFETPSDAVQCASRLHRALGRIGIELRIGIHCGEVEVRGHDIAGIAVHLAARVQAAANPGETWVTSTVKEAMAGTATRFTDRGAHELKGIPGRWRLFALAT